MTWHEYYQHKKKKIYDKDAHIKALKEIIRKLCRFVPTTEIPTSGWKHIDEELER